MSQNNFLFLLDFDTVATVVFFALIPTMVIGLIVAKVRFCRTVKRRMAEWAAENGLQLLDIHWEFGTGPFDKSLPTRDVCCYMFTTVDIYGTEATGWVRWNMWFDKWDRPSIVWAPKTTR